eukprot:9503893-Pyramimonas_sp.AAC.3
MCNLSRDKARALHQVWVDEHGAPDAVCVSCISPRCLSGRWNSVSTAERYYMAMGRTPLERRNKFMAVATRVFGPGPSAGRARGGGRGAGRGRRGGRQGRKGGGRGVEPESSEAAEADAASHALVGADVALHLDESKAYTMKIGQWRTRELNQTSERASLASPMPSPETSPTIPDSLCHSVPAPLRRRDVLDAGADIMLWCVMQLANKSRSPIDHFFHWLSGQKALGVPGNGRGWTG